MSSITELVFNRHYSTPQDHLRLERIVYCETKAKHCQTMAQTTDNPQKREYYRGLSAWWIEHAKLAKKGY